MKVYLNFRAKNNVKIYIFGVKIQTETFLLILKHCARWWPNDTSKCGTTENLMNHLFYDINDIIKHAEVLYEDLKEVEFKPNQTEFWSIHHEFRVGRCFIFSIKHQDKKIIKITLNFKVGGGALNVYFHSPGLFKTSGLMNRKSIDVQTTFPRSESVEIIVDYEVYKMLDFGGAECNNDPEYNRSESKCFRVLLTDGADFWGSKFVISKKVIEQKTPNFQLLF